LPYAVEDKHECRYRSQGRCSAVIKHIGAEIRGIDLRTALDADTIKQIHQAWLDHSVLLFRNQSFSQEDLLRVTGYFGELAPLTRPAKFFP
jgi:alpha-ketoglutarate-dependent taurine dioxygenase